MAKPNHRQRGVVNAPAAPAKAKSGYEPGGNIGLLHDRIEQQLAAQRMTATVLRPASLDPFENVVHSASRASGPAVLIAAVLAIVWGLVTVLA